MIVHPPLHAAYVYDMLAILLLKVDKTDASLKAVTNHHELNTYLISAIGGVTHVNVLYSPEFQSLYFANLAVFDRIDLIKTRPATGEDAIYIDQQNYARYQAKLALQKRFFPDCPFAEQKIGYDKGAA